MTRDSRHRILQAGYAGYPYRAKADAGNDYTTVLVRYRPNGRIDRSFGRNGFVRSRLLPERPSAIATQRNGRILVASIREAHAKVDDGPTYMMSVTRYLPSGKLDRSFFNNGTYRWSKGSASISRDVQIDRKGRIVVTGGAAIGGTGNFVIKRFLPGR